MCLKEILGHFWVTGVLGHAQGRWLYPPRHTLLSQFLIVQTGDLPGATAASETCAQGMDGMSLGPCSKAWPGRAHSWAQVLSSAPSLGTAHGPVPRRGEPRAAGDSLSSRCLISWVWWCEDGARPAVEAFSPGSRCVANTADISIPALHCTASAGPRTGSEALDLNRPC